MSGGSAHLTPSERLKGTRVGSYEIVRVIGHGATASVFEGTHTALGKPVAIKILHEHLGSDVQIRERFLREGRIAARLRHPNIVDVVDVGLEGTTPYLVMDLLAGADLRTLMADVGRLEPAHALALLLPIASALAHAHDVGVVHRDLKPANIFLARDMRDDVVPTLVDFGLSKAAGGDVTSSLTESELVAGTALYMAPEQTVGVKNSSAASDQYALAAILYEAVTGTTPFEPDAIYVLLERIRTDAIASPSSKVPRVPAGLSDVILRALHRDPASRFPGMRAFGAALLPFTDPLTARTLERDFGERTSGPLPTGSRPSIRQAAAEAATRFETSDSGAQLKPAFTFNPPPGRTTAPLPCAAGASPFHIKGLAYRGFIHMLNRVVPGGVDGFCDILDDATLRPFLHQPFLATARYDVLPFVPLFAALAKSVGGNFTELVRTATAGQCRYDARTAYRVIFASDRVEDIGDRIGRFCAQYYDFGKYTGSNPKAGHLVVTHEEIPEYLYVWQGPMHAAYAEECIRIVGAKKPRLLSHSVTHAGRGGKRGEFPLITMRSEFTWGELVP